MKKVILSMLAVALLITVNIQAQETSKKVLVEKAITQNSKEISERDKEVDKKIKYMQKKASWGTGNVVAIKTIFQKLNDTIKNNKTNPKIFIRTTTPCFLICVMILIRWKKRSKHKEYLSLIK